MDRTQYWNEFYTASQQIRSLNYPSQFAAFVYGETLGIDNILEFGCGTGRDAFFFADLGKKVYAFDGSQSVVKANKLKCETYQNRPSFQVFNVDKDFPGLGGRIDGAKCIYARFFIHALGDEQIKKFFALCESTLVPGEKLYLEYRTEKDADGIRETAEHYRNYLNSNQITQILDDYGFTCEYNVEGVGYAKWGADDAHVARHVMVR